ncbi:MAG: hypothetical protein ACFFDN_34155 [Candidatus Hodarchaeota archaeon]
MNNITDKMYHGLKKLRDGILEFGNDIYQQMEYRNKFYLILSRINWPPPHDLFIYSSQKEVNELVDRYEKFGIDVVKNDVDDLMLTWHSPKIVEKIFTDWRSKPWLDKRIPILKDAIWAHQNGLYTLSIPSLLPQIEGIIADNFRINEYLTGKKYKEYFKKILNEAVIIKNRNENINNFLINVLLVRFIHGDKILSTLGRHAILHGGDATYATKINSLRAILFINAINKLLRLEALSNSKIVHLNSCSLVKNSKKTRKFFATLLEATLQGYKPCSKCINRNTTISLLLR